MQFPIYNSRKIALFRIWELARAERKHHQRGVPYSYAINPHNQIPIYIDPRTAAEQCVAVDNRLHC